MSALVDLRKFSSEPDAKITRTFLENNGVPTFVFKPRSNPRLSMNESAIHLKVEIRNYERALALLNEKFNEPCNKLDL